MPDRDLAATPLRFGIAASLAVLPVLLGIVWLVAVARPADAVEALAERHSDPRRGAALRSFESAIVERTASMGAPRARAVLDGIAGCRAAWGQRRGGAAWWPLGPASSVASAAPLTAERVAAQLARFDATLHRFSSHANAPVERPVGLDATRWFEAASAGLRSRAFGCDDLAAAAAGVGRAAEAELLTWGWRGRTAPLARADWSATQQVAIDPGQTARGNPWAGVPGCIVFGGGDGALHVVATPGSVAGRLCAGEAPALAAAAPTASAAAAITTAPGEAMVASTTASAVQTETKGRPATEAVASRTMAPPTATPPSDLAARAPGIPGARALRVVTATEPAVDEPPTGDRWSVPPSVDAMLAPLAAWRKPVAGGSGPRASLDGVPIALGRPVVLTIDPVLQALAQKTAACYTGRHAVCRTLGLVRTADAGRPPGSGLLEGAMVRMAAVAIVDVPSGRIDALAGARTACARQEVDGPGRDPSCDARLPWPVRFRPDALLNPAVFHDAMPASTVKPVLAAALMADGENGGRLLAAERAGVLRERGGAPARGSLRGELVRSDSARFLDRLFCADRAFAADCVRPWQVADAAMAFGWNAGCAALDDRPRGSVEGRGVRGSDSTRRSDGAHCGRRDLLTGHAGAVEGLATSGARPPARPVSFGRLMVEPRDGTLQAFAPTRLDSGRVARCAAGADGRRGSDDDWEKCKGGRIVDVVAEGWGQGHARASALGVAGMMAALAAAADGRAAPPPHLLRAGPWNDAAGGATASPGLPTEAALTVMQALSWTHRTGTARSACVQVLGAARCGSLEGLAGKTGTPSFPGDGMTLDAIAALCHAGGDARVAPSDPERAERRRRACGPLRPDKWYVAAWRSGGAADGPWSKAIAVLVERNWSQTTGLVQGAGDHGPNPAAEIALQITGRALGWLPAAPGEAVQAIATTGPTPRALR